MNAKKADPAARQQSAGDVEPAPRTPDVAAHQAAQEMLGALESMCVDWESGGWRPNPGDAGLALNLLLAYGWDKTIPAMVGFACDQGLHGRQFSALREHWEAHVGVGNAWLRKRRVVLLPEREPPPAGFVEVPLILLGWDAYFPGAFALAGSQFAKHEEDRRSLLETFRETQGAFVRLDRLPDPKEPCYGEETQWISRWDNAIAFIEHTHELPKKLNRTTLERRLKRSEIPYEASEGGSKKMRIRRFDLDRLRLPGLCRCDRCVPVEGEGLAVEEDDTE